MVNARAEVNRMINAIPDEKMIYVLNVLRGMSGFAMEEEEPDAFDLQLMAQAKNDSDATVSFEEAIKEMGFELDEFQN